MTQENEISGVSRSLTGTEWLHLAWGILLTFLLLNTANEGEWGKSIFFLLLIKFTGPSLRD